MQLVQYGARLIIWSTKCGSMNFLRMWLYCIYCCIYFVNSKMIISLNWYRQIPFHPQESILPDALNCGVQIAQSFVSSFTKSHSVWPNMMEVNKTNPKGKSVKHHPHYVMVFWILHIFSFFSHITQPLCRNSYTALNMYDSIFWLNMHYVKFCFSYLGLI